MEQGGYRWITRWITEYEEIEIRSFSNLKAMKRARERETAKQRRVAAIAKCSIYLYWD